MSQIKLNYRGQPLSEGRAGKVHGGDRLPWVKTSGQDNYTSLSHIGWQAHIYGESSRSLASWCEERGLPLHIFPFLSAHKNVGLKRDALYLLRPDTYVALASDQPSAEMLQRYFQEQKIIF